MNPGSDRRREIHDLLGAARQALSSAGLETPELDAEVLMARAMNVTREQLLADTVELKDDATRRFAGFVARRAAREPLAYIVGRKEFFSLEFEVNRNVLIPRPETESLVGAVLEAIAGSSGVRILDLGTGCGAIAVAIAANAPAAEVVATDISKAALEVARDNARSHGCVQRIRFLEGDMWDALEPSASPFDLVVSNPPYIEESELARLAPEIARFEPRIALAAGPDGLNFYRVICGRAREHLKPGGALIVEVGMHQALAVAELCRRHSAREVRALRDPAGVERVVTAKF